MTSTNSFAGLVFGVALLMTATSVPMVRSNRNPSVSPHASNAQEMDRAVTDLQTVVEAQRQEARSFHQDALRIVSISQDADDASYRGTVRPRRQGSANALRSAPETTPHVQPQTH